HVIPSVARNLALKIARVADQFPGAAARGGAQAAEPNIGVCACILISWLRNFQVDGLLFRRVGRSALRPGPVPRACEVDGPPALFSQAEENLRPRLAGSLYLQARLERAQGRGAATAA